jgi:hypothetical protein
VILAGCVVIGIWVVLLVMCRAAERQLEDVLQHLQHELDLQDHETLVEAVAVSQRMHANLGFALAMTLAVVGFGIYQYFL